MLPRLVLVMIIFLLVNAATQSQTNIIDSLKKDFQQATKPQQQLAAIFALCQERQSISSDTLFHYLQMGNALSKKINNPLFVKQQLQFYTAGYYLKIGKSDTAISIINGFVYGLGKDSAQRALKTNALFLKSTALIRAGLYKEALDQSYLVLQLADASKDNFLQVMSMNSIGWAYLDMEQNEIAIGWFRKAIATAKDTMLLEHYSFVYSNIASCYDNVGQYDSAIYFINKALRSARKSQNMTALANTLNIEADIYINTNVSSRAGACLEEALLIRREIGDTFYLVSDMAQLAVYYANNKKTQQGIATAREGIAIATRAELGAKLLNLYEALALNYKNAGNYELYSNTMEKIVVLKDSTYKENAVDAMEHLKTNSDLKSKNTELAAQHFVVNKKNMQLFGSLIIFSLAVTFFYLLFKQYKQKESIKLTQALAKEKIIAEQAVVTAEENQRKRIAADLHDNLGVQANAILYGTELLIQDQVQKDVLVTNLHDTAKDMLVSLRETLWAMKAADVNAADVWLRVINFSKQMQRYYQSISITANGIAPPGFTINAAKALHAVLIVQEAVNNAARHSMAGNIVIASNNTDNGWQIEISDDGKGFDVTEIQQKNESYGLGNMKERAAAASLAINIRTKPLAGTHVLLTIPFA